MVFPFSAAYSTQDVEEMITNRKRNETKSDEKKSEAKLNSLPSLVEAGMFDGLLRAFIMSMPDLESAYQQYVKAANENSPVRDFVGSNRKVIQEYASFIERDGQYLLPAELHMIALVLDYKIHFYTCDLEKGKNKIYATTYNPQASGREYCVQFNGRAHYEAVEFDVRVSPVLRI